jgi:hypothetical protein
VTRLLAVGIVSLAAAACGQATPAPEQTAGRQCWFDSLSDSEKRALVFDFARVHDAEGKSRADSWAHAQKAAYEERAVASGACPSTGAALAQGSDVPPQKPTLPPQEIMGSDAPQILNRHGKPCKRIELENQNVPNPGGAMGWALIPVCKD